MKKFTFIFTFFILCLVLFFYRQTTQSFLSDIENRNGNTISIATDFSSPPSNLADHLVISEVQIHGGNANEDFVELYNPTNTEVTLDGWKIRVKNSAGTEESLFLIESGESIPAHGFFLWGSDKRNGYATSIGADVTNENTLSENYSLALKKPNDEIVDQVAWGNGTDPFVEGTSYPNSPATNKSIERKAYGNSTSESMTSGLDVGKGNAYDSGNNLNDFILREVSNPQNSGSLTETP